MDLTPRSTDARTPWLPDRLPASPSRPGHARAWLALTGLALAVVSCSTLPGLGATVERQGTRLSLVVQGYREADTQGFLCPADPGPGPDRGEEGTTRLLRTGCLDLGVTASIDPGATGWSAVVNLESLASAQLEAFSNRQSYRLILVSGGESGGRAYATDVPAVNLVP